MSPGDLPHSPIPDSYWLIEGKLLAGEYPGTYIETNSREKLAKFLDAGIRTFIDLTEERELSKYDHLLTQLAKERGIETRHVRQSIRDYGVPTARAQMVSILTTIREESPPGSREGERVPSDPPPEREPPDEGPAEQPSLPTGVAQTGKARAAAPDEEEAQSAKRFEQVGVDEILRAPDRSLIPDQICATDNGDRHVSVVSVEARPPGVAEDHAVDRHDEIDPVWGHSDLENGTGVHQVRR